jgi:hypothetical protein
MSSIDRQETVSMIPPVVIWHPTAATSLDMCATGKDRTIAWKKLSGCLVARQWGVHPQAFIFVAVGTS